MSQTNPPDRYEVEEARGPYHNFWFLRRAEREYANYWDLLPRKDAPIRLSDDLFGYFEGTLQWVPTINPGSGKPGSKDNEQYGFNRYGVTVVAQAGAEYFRDICSGWAQILSRGPEPLIFSHGLISQDDDTTIVSHPDASTLVGSYPGEIVEQAEDGGAPFVWRPYRFRTSRDRLVSDLRLLAQWGEQAGTGEYFILHLGI